jgi:hypothetical protein
MYPLVAPAAQDGSCLVNIPNPDNVSNSVSNSANRPTKPPLNVSRTFETWVWQYRVLRVSDQNLISECCGEYVYLSYQILITFRYPLVHIRLVIGLRWH